MAKDKTDRHILNNGRKCIAVLSGPMTSYYQSSIVKGAIEVCKELDYNLLAYVGGPINNPDKSEQTRDTIFKHIDTDIVDGIIIPSGSHSRYISDSELDEFLNTCSSIPIVNISGYLDYTSNVIVDFTTGIEDLINHYIDVHHYTKIAIIRGPKKHPTSDLRTDIYKKVLKKRGIEVDDKLIIFADMMYSSAEYAISQLLDVNRAACEAIITVNDNLANGIIKALNKRGYKVPDDIAVAGSMNSPICKHTHPRLTSIYEPVYDLGREAVRELHRQFEGGSCSYEIIVPSSLVIRESCGCGMRDVLHSNDFNRSRVDEEIFNTTISHCESILNKHGPIQGYDTLYELYDYYKEAIIHSNSTKLIRCIKSLLETTFNTDDLIFWLEIISEIKKGLLQLGKYRSKDSYYWDIYIQIDMLKEKYNIFTCEAIKNEMSSTVDNFRLLISNLNADFDLGSAKELIMNTLELTDLFITTYDGSIERGNSVITAKDGKFIDLPKSERSFNTKALLPEALGPIDKRYSYLIFPLSYRIEATGYLILDYTYKIGLAYENMQVIISTVLKNENQIKQLEEAKKSLIEYQEHLEDIVEERTLELKQSQKMLIESEKIASLGGLVAGVAHQLNTPLGICVTLISHIKELTEELSKNLAGNTISRNNLKEFISNTIESSDIVLNNLYRATSNIDQFKEVSVINSQDERRVFNLRTYIELVIDNYTSKVDINGYNIILNCSKDIMMNAYPGALSNILSQLITNSIDHGYLNRGYGDIIISVVSHSDFIYLSVKDYGMGVNVDDKNSIFNPFFTTKSSQGKQGLGLNIVYNLVFQSFKGTIECISSEDDGTEFKITLPVDQ